MMASSHRAGKEPSCEWSKANTDHFLDILLAFHRAGRISGKTINDALWNEVLGNLIARTGVVCTMSQIRDKHKRMKKDWTVFKGLLDAVDGEWDSERGTIIVDDEKKKVLKHDKDFKMFQKKGMDRYKDMCEMWADVSANRLCGMSNDYNAMSIHDERGDIHLEDEPATQTETYLGGKPPNKGKSRGRKSPHPYSRSGSTSGMKFKSYKSRTKSLPSFGDDYVWSIKKCVEEVMGFQHISLTKRVNAGMAFQNRELREVYMSFELVARMWWVDNNFV